MSRWGGRANYSLEFSAVDGLLETRAGLGRRELRGDEARRTNAGFHSGADGNDRRFTAGRGGEYR